MNNIKKALGLVLISTVSMVSANTTTLVTDTAMIATSSGETTVSTVGSVSLDIPAPPRLTKVTDTSVELTWDKAEGASSYIVKYDKNSVASSTDENAHYTDETDQVTVTGATITGLDPNTTYYFSVFGLDQEGREGEGPYELAVKTTSAVSSFAIANVMVIDNKNFSIEFNADLSADPVTVKVVKTSDVSTVTVASVEKDAMKPNTANVKLASVLDPSSTYQVTVISAKDMAGNNIQEGVNGLKEFPTPENLPVSIDTLNAAAASGSMMTGAEGTGATLSGALSNSTSLPATGAKENLILMAALLLSLGIVYGFRRKLA